MIGSYFGNASWFWEVIVMNGNCRQKKGFTLVELLVVIAIIGILIALLLPAVQAAREAARRSQCVNNLKQIGLAVHNYHDTHGYLPAGAYWYNNNQSDQRNRGSILIRLLPYIEQQALYEMFDLNFNPAHQTDPGGTPLVQFRVPTYICPSDTNSELLNGEADPIFGVPAELRFTANYVASAGSYTKGTGSPDCFCPLATQWNSFVIRPEIRLHTYPSGPFSRQGQNWMTTLAAITGGTSNTIMFGEVRRDCSDIIRSGWTRANNGQGLHNTTIPINWDTCRSLAQAEALGLDGCRARCNWTMDSGFQSRHPGGANFLLVDGSVHFFAETIDHHVYQLLGDMTTATKLP